MITPLMPDKDTPAGYPRDYERRFDLGDGRIVFVRPVVPGDAPLLATEVAATDSETLYQRFFNPSVRLDGERIKMLTEVDYRNRFALAAFDSTGRGLAIARYEPSGPHCAEVAVVVREPWRKAGIATVLLTMLEEAAAERGIVELEAYYLAGNRAVERVLVKRGFGRPTIETGVARVTKAVAPAG
jgi:GNAT superfamily N-acetyltransferase